MMELSSAGFRASVSRAPPRTIALVSMATQMSQNQVGPLHGYSSYPGKRNKSLFHLRSHQWLSGSAQDTVTAISALRQTWCSGQLKIVAEWPEFQSVSLSYVSLGPFKENFQTKLTATTSKIW